MTSWFSTTGKVMLILGLATFLFFGLFGMSHSTMNMGPDGSMTMSDCPLMSGQAVVCNMNPLEHIAAWQSMFTGMLQQSSSDLLALLLTALGLALVWTKILWPRLDQEPRLAFAVVAGRQNYLPPPLLQELFSNGILNPKVFKDGGFSQSIPLYLYHS